MIQFKYQLNDVEVNALSTYGLANTIVQGYMDNDLIHNVDNAKMFMIGRMVGDENSYTYYEPEAIIAYTDTQAIRTYSEIHDAHDAALIFQLKDNCKKLEVMN